MMPAQNVGATMSSLQSSLDVANANMMAMNSTINYLQSNAAMSMDVANTCVTQAITHVFALAHFLASLHLFTFARMAAPATHIDKRVASLASSHPPL